MIIDIEDINTKRYKEHKYKPKLNIGQMIYYNTGRPI